MALVANGFTGYVTLTDNGGNRTTKTYDLRSATAADAASDMLSVATALAAITQAKVVSYGATQVFVEDALVLPPTSAQVEMQALITARIADEPLKTATLSIPAPIDAVFVSTSGASANQVNTSFAALNTYVNLFKSTGVCYISDGETLDFMESGRRIHRGSRKG